MIGRKPCPEWCKHEHLGVESDPHGFHHDGPVTAIAVQHPVTEVRGADLFVNVSKHEHPGGLDESPYVEVQDAQQTLALLTPVECLALSRALLEAAATVADHSQLDGVGHRQDLQVAPPVSR